MTPTASRFLVKLNIAFSLDFKMVAAGTVPRMGGIALSFPAVIGAGPVPRRAFNLPATARLRKSRGRMESMHNAHFRLVGGACTLSAITTGVLEDGHAGPAAEGRCQSARRQGGGRYRLDQRHWPWNRPRARGGRRQCGHQWTRRAARDRFRLRRAR